MIIQLELARATCNLWQRDDFLHRPHDCQCQRKRCDCLSGADALWPGRSMIAWLVDGCLALRIGYVSFEIARGTVGQRDAAGLLTAFEMLSALGCGCSYEQSHAIARFETEVWRARYECGPVDLPGGICHRLLH